MNQIWVAADWHLYNTSLIDPRHPQRSKYNLQALQDDLKKVPFHEDDLFILLGDLCDPEVTTPDKIADILSVIPCKKLLTRGNHDTEEDTWYYDAGFDYVCDVCLIHTLVFSHIPVIIDKDKINIHGHLHTLKISTIGSQYVNAFYGNPCINVEDLLEKGVMQSPKEYEITTDVQKEMNTIFSVEFRKAQWEGLSKLDILDLTDEFKLVPLDENTELNEIIFDDIDQTEYWEQDDLYDPGQRKKEPMAENTKETHIKELMESFIAQLPKETGAIPEFNYYPESTYGDMNILNIRQVKANNNNKQFLEIMYQDKTDIKKRIQSVILMNRDYFYDILNCNPDKLQSEELKAIKSTKELEKYADRILNSITYEEHTPAFALYSILNLMGTDSISYSDKKLIEFVKMLLYGDNMKDVFNFDRYINGLIKAVQEIEDLYLNIIATNLKLFDIGVVQSTKEFTKINPTVYQEIEKYVNDPKNGIIQHDMSTTVYDFSKFHLGKVLLANDILMENPWLTPSRFIPRVHYYDYVIYTHGDTNQSYQYDKFIMNPIVYRHNTYTIMEELLDRIMKENPNNKVLIVSCNGAGIHLGKYTDSTNVTYSNNINLMEAAQNITVSNTMKKMLKFLEDKLELYTTLPLTLTWSLRNYEFLIPTEFKYITLGRKGNNYTIKMKELSSKRYSSNTVIEFYQEELMKSFNCILILYKAISYLIGLYYNIDTVKEIPFQENVIGKLLSQYEVYTPYGYLGKNSYDIAYKII